MLQQDTKQRKKTDIILRLKANVLINPENFRSLKLSLQYFIIHIHIFKANFTTWDHLFSEII